MRPVSLASGLARFTAPERHATPFRRVRLLAKFDGFDPLAGVRVGESTLADFSFSGADLCQNEFGNCELRSLGVA